MLLKWGEQRALRNAEEMRLKEKMEEMLLIEDRKILRSKITWAISHISHGLPASISLSQNTEKTRLFINKKSDIVLVSNNLPILYYLISFII